MHCSKCVSFWGTSYSRDPLLIRDDTSLPPPCYKILAVPLPTSHGGTCEYRQMMLGLSATRSGGGACSSFTTLMNRRCPGRPPGVVVVVVPRHRGDAGAWRWCAAAAAPAPWWNNLSSFSASRLPLELCRGRDATVACSLLSPRGAGPTAGADAGRGRQPVVDLLLFLLAWSSSTASSAPPPPLSSSSSEMSSSDTR